MMTAKGGNGDGSVSCQLTCRLNICGIYLAEISLAQTSILDSASDKGEARQISAWRVVCEGGIELAASTMLRRRPSQWSVHHRLTSALPPPASSPSPPHLLHPHSQAPIDTAAVVTFRSACIFHCCVHARFLTQVPSGLGFRLRRHRRPIAVESFISFQNLIASQSLIFSKCEMNACIRLSIFYGTIVRIK